MPPKVRSKQAISLKIKQEIVNKHDKGIRISALVNEYGFPQSTISTIIKQKEIIKNIKVADESKLVKKGREIIIEMERLLLLWIREKQMKGDTVPASYICERARQIYDELKQDSPSSTDATPFDDFKASKGWFEGFKKRANIKSVVRHSEASNADKEAAEAFHHHPTNSSNPRILKYMKMSDGMVSLSWDNHTATFFHFLSTLRKKERYADVTVACDGKFYKVHKLVLSASSEYFEKMFENTPCKHPVIVLKDIQTDELEALLSYMYEGSVSVAKEGLTRLIKAADMLSIKGLPAPDEASVSEIYIKQAAQSQSALDSQSSPHLKRKHEESNTSLQGIETSTALPTFPVVSPLLSDCESQQSTLKTHTDSQWMNLVSSERKEQTVAHPSDVYTTNTHKEQTVAHSVGDFTVITHKKEMLSHPVGDYRAIIHKKQTLSSPLGNHTTITKEKQTLAYPLEDRRADHTAINFSLTPPKDEVTVDEIEVKEEIVDYVDNSKSDNVNSTMDYGSISSTDAPSNRMLSKKLEPEITSSQDKTQPLPGAVVMALMGHSGMQGEITLQHSGVEACRPISEVQTIPTEQLHTFVLPLNTAEQSTTVSRYLLPNLSDWPSNSNISLLNINEVVKPSNTARKPPAVKRRLLPKLSESPTFEPASSQEVSNDSSTCDRLSKTSLLCKKKKHGLMMESKIIRSYNRRVTEPLTCRKCGKARTSLLHTQYSGYWFCAEKETISLEEWRLETKEKIKKRKLQILK